MLILFLILLFITLITLYLEYGNPLKYFRNTKVSPDLWKDSLHKFQVGDTITAVKELPTLLSVGYISRLTLQSEAKEFDEKKSQKQFCKLLENKNCLEAIKKSSQSMTFPSIIATFSSLI